jgi:hypothetical protein
MSHEARQGDFSRRQIFNEKTPRASHSDFYQFLLCTTRGWLSFLALSMSVESVDPCFPKKEHVSIAITTAKGPVLGVQEKVTCTSQMF